jgi:hypothetical protein
MIINKNYIAGSEWWVNSENLSFPEILIQSRVPPNWARYNIYDISNIDSILKPVNRYVLNLYPKPKILKIENNLVTFRQRTHAEIWVEEKNNNIIYALDKCHQRQFYPSLNNIENKDCFKPTYRFYIPWFINKDINITISSVEDENTPFYVNKKNIISKYINNNEEYVKTGFVDFKIKNTNDYHLKEKYGIISKNTAMYDMSVVFTNEELLKLGDQYARE